MKPHQTETADGWIICHHDGRSGPKTPPKERKPRTLSAALRKLAEDERQGARVRFDELEEMAIWAKQMERAIRQAAEILHREDYHATANMVAAAALRPKGKASK